MASSILSFSISEKPGQCLSSTEMLLSEGCYSAMDVPLNPVTGSPLLGLCDTRLRRWVQWQHRPPTLSLMKGNRAPICPSCVPLRLYETDIWFWCSELRKGFHSLSFFPFASFTSLTIPNLQSALIIKFLLIRRLTDYANYIQHLWPSISSGATFCICYPLTESSHILIMYCIINLPL